MRCKRRKKRRLLTRKNKRVACAGVGVTVLLSVVSIGTIKIVNFCIDSVVASKESVKEKDDIVLKEESSDINKEVENYKSDSNNGVNEIINSNKDVVNSSEYIKLVNKQNVLTKDYKPSDLVIPQIRFKKGTQNKYVRKEVARALEKMFNDACDDKVYLIGVSGYRSYDYQAGLYQRSIVKGETTYVAKPGSSEHQLGLAMDVLSSEYSRLDEGFEATVAFEWLKENMHKYGFILRYAKGKEKITGYSYEPWHLRYVGVEVAKAIKEKGVTLEEYLEK